MSTELTYLVLTALLTAVLWVPYIIMLIGQMGLVQALMDRQHEFRLDPAWARRSQRAHANAVENLVIFAVVILALEISPVESTGLTAGTAAAYFWLRVAHAAVYIMGLPVVRTLLFAAGFACQMAIGLTVLGVL